MDNCSSPELMDLSQALKEMMVNVVPVKNTRILPLNDALGFVLADDIVAPINVPSFTNSAMDGYAFKHREGITQFEMVGTSLAGHPYQEVVPEHACVRIMTGAPIPDGCDTVVMQEHCEVTGNTLLISRLPAPLSNVRAKGSDLRQGSAVLSRYTRLTPRHIPLLANLGIANITVFHQPKVAFFSTGDELQPVGSVLQEGQIYDSNRYTLTALLKKAACEIIDLGRVPDHPDAIKATLLDAAKKADLILTTGGVSVGDADHVKAQLEALGQVHFWKIAIKPGKPFAFGTIESEQTPPALFCGLPGNPVSALVTFLQLVRPLLSRLSASQTDPAPVTLSAIACEPLRKSSGRLDFQRGIATCNPQGHWEVRSAGAQNSGVFSPLAEANCFIVLERERGNIAEGDTVTIELFDHFLY
uniref:molybdopterin molybdotransferase MoeA n=1 Tax=Thaumasiovibrio occultus TaxID=1891184 RepID=UPI000B35A022|nr:gephyrin-like molybdotransferase Glp [Thaumasiovibrio occultus]